MSWSEDPNKPHPPPPPPVPGMAPPPTPSSPGAQQLPPPPPSMVPPPPPTPSSPGTPQPPPANPYSTAHLGPPAGPHSTVGPHPAPSLNPGTALSTSWRILSTNFGPFAAIVALYGVIWLTLWATSSVISDYSQATFSPSDHTSPNYAHPLAYLVSALSVALNFAAMCILFRAANIALASGKVFFTQAFTGIKWLPTLVVSAGCLVALTLGIAFTCLLGLFFLPAFFLYAIPAAVNGDSISNAFATISGLAAKNFGSSIALTYLCLALLVAGSVAFIVPVFFVSTPMVFIALTYAYRALSGQPVPR